MNRFICLVRGHKLSNWRKTSKKPEKFRLCSRCGKRECRPLTMAEAAEYEAENRRRSARPRAA
jgi:hypothetical protein